MLFILGCKEDRFRWTHKGVIVEGIMPAAGGDMRITSDEQIYIFDPRTPAYTRFLPSDGIPPDEYVPEYAEEWMNNASERNSRRSVRLLRSDLNGTTQILFQEYGQGGYWWISEDLKQIYILVDWIDFTKQEPNYLSFWKSADGGETFKKINWGKTELGRGQTVGMYFDEQGVNGYIFVNENTLLQTKDAGEHWEKRYIPYSTAEPLFFNEFPIDSAVVDHEGNLIFSLLKEGADEGSFKSVIYEVLVTNDVADISQMAAKHGIENKRILTMNRIPDEKGIYLTYIECKSVKPCRWKNEISDENPRLNFAILQEGELLKTQQFEFFMPVKNFYAGADGKIAMTLEMPNYYENSLLLSQDGGESWELHDLTEHRVISEYIDFKRNQYWQHRRENQVFVSGLVE